MKRLLICLLAAIIILGVAACKGKETSSGGSEGSDGALADGKKIELTFWAHQQPAWNNSYQAIADGFTAENPNIVIKYEFFPYDQFESKLQTSLIAKSGGADIYELWGGWGVDFASTGALAAMPDDLAESIRNDSYLATFGALEHNGKIYGVPMEFNIECGGMLVNLQLLEQNGLEIPKTWDDLIAGARKATVIEGNYMAVKGFDFVNWDSVTFLLTSMILSNGGQYLKDDGTFNFTSPQAKDAFTELTRLVLEEKVTDIYGLTGGDDMESYQLLFSDRALFVPRGPWTIAEGTDTFERAYGTDFRYVAMPWYGSAPAFPAETGWSLAVNGNSKEQEAAFKFLEYFFRDDVIRSHNVECAMIPPKKSVAVSQEYINQMPYMQVLVNILDKSQYIGHFNTDVFKETINNVFVDYCSGIYSSVDEALIDLEDKLNSSLAE